MKSLTKQFNSSTSSSSSKTRKAKPHHRRIVSMCPDDLMQAMKAPARKKTHQKTRSFDLSEPSRPSSAKKTTRDYIEEAAAFNKQNLKNELLLRRLELQEWNHAKKSYNRRVFAEIQQHALETQLADTEFARKTAASARIKQLQDRVNTEKEFLARKETKQKIQQENSQRHKDDLKRSEDYSSFLDRVKKDKEAVAVEEREEAKRYFLENLSTQKTMKCLEQLKNQNDSSQQDYQEALSQWKIAKASQQRLSADIEYLKKILQK